MTIRLKQIASGVLTTLALLCTFGSHPVAGVDGGWIGDAPSAAYPSGAAAFVYPYVEIANDVYGNTAGAPISGSCSGVPCVWTRVSGNWQAVFKTAGYNQSYINQIE